MSHDCRIIDRDDLLHHQVGQTMVKVVFNVFKLMVIVGHLSRDQGGIIFFEWTERGRASTVIDELSESAS